jgi:hypothetical protein
MYTFLEYLPAKRLPAHSCADCKAVQDKKLIHKQTMVDEPGNATADASPAVKISVTASHDGGNAELISVTEPIISSGGRTAKCTVNVHVKPGE